MENMYDLIVIGGGPGGYTAALHAAKLGLNTALVEEREIGGTCLHRGCIPTKVMLHVAELLRYMKDSCQFGIHADGIRLDYGEMLTYRNDTVQRLTEGVKMLLKNAGVVCINGRGNLLANNCVLVTGSDGEKKLYSTKIILATGSRPKMLPIPGIELPGVITSDGVFALNRLPDSLTIIGGGAIGVEFAEAFSTMGSRVTLLEAQPRLLPGLDRDFSQSLRMVLKNRGAEIHVGASIEKIWQDNDELVCNYTENGKTATCRSEYIICAVGRTPNTNALFDGNAIPPLAPSGHVIVDESLMTGIRNVYAIGDLIPGMQLAHAASAQGRAVAEHIAGRASSALLELIPNCVYTAPEIAQVGLTEQAAKGKGLDVQTAKIPMTSNPRTRISRSARGFMKVVTQIGTDRILGAQLMCDRASDLIGEFTLAIANRLTVSQMLRAVRAHPTFEESVSDLMSLIPTVD